MSSLNVMGFMVRARSGVTDGLRSFRPAPDRFGYDGPAFDPYD